MKRVVILLMDSFGVGNAPDAEEYGDKGADTLGHIVEECAVGNADNDKRSGTLKLPNLSRLGLQKAAEESRGSPLKTNLGYEAPIEGVYGYASEQSKGKDTPSGHWEIAGFPVMFTWGFFDRTIPCFPKELVENFIKEANLPGVLGEKHASGTAILEELGEEHIRTGKPIIYTSADSVFQIAAHEKYFGLERLYEICEIARELVNKYNIGRVIARPFVGEKSGQFKRTANRHDIGIPPSAPTLLDELKDSGGEVVSIGKIADIFAGSGITKRVKSDGLKELFDATLKELKSAGNNTLIFTNFVNFDAEFGHRRDVAGYASGLEYIDSRIPDIEKILSPEDIIVITADHGCDPTWKGTDHTREHIPILIYGPSIKPKNVGGRETFADIGASIAQYMNIGPLNHGKPFNLV